MYETLIRPHEVHNIPELQTVQSIGDRLKRSEVRREEKRLKQIAASARKHNEKAETKKRKREEREGAKDDGGGNDGLENERAEAAGDIQQTSSADPEYRPQKKARSEDADPEQQNDGDTIADASNAGTMPANPIVVAHPGNSDAAPSTTEGRYFPSKANERDSRPSPPSEPQKTVVSRVPNEVRGHTSYLTFATLLPLSKSVIPSTDKALLKTVSNGRSEASSESPSVSAGNGSNQQDESEPMADER